MNYIQQYEILLPLILAVFLGTNFGKHLLKMIPEKLFKKLFKIALVLIANKDINVDDQLNSLPYNEEKKLDPNLPNQNKPQGIDLPGFVSKRSERLRNSLRTNQSSQQIDKEPIVPIVKDREDGYIIMIYVKENKE